ncbi:MAG: NAD-binding protein [Myxococcota bacterium]|nr:NAD-binding protein [Myxococcota bacterium]
MKFLSSELAYLLREREARQNLKALSRYVALLTGIILAYSVIFHLLMLREGQEHSWITGFYWTLTVMSTLGFGDITFHTDLGRAFSILVLLSGLVLLLIVLPFVFIRLFYAPWLEAQLHLRAPRELREDVRGHVILTRWDTIARGLRERLSHLGIPCTVIEPDPTAAVELHADGISVICGDVDNVETYQAARAGSARLVFTNLEDAANTNVIVTVRERFPDVMLAALAEHQDAVDILQLAGATHVIPLKHQLGEQLASRVDVGMAMTQVVGRFEDLLIAEFPVHNTQLVGRTIRDTKLREVTGINIIATWEAGQLLPGHPDTVLSSYSVPVLVGTQEQFDELDAMFTIYEPNENPVLVLGGGKVGCAAVAALKARGVSVHAIERDASLRDELARLADRVFIGDASDRKLMTEAGIANAPSVVLSTADDATNIFLAVYCRQLNPDARIISRITEARNRDAVHRAGADSVLSYSTLGAQSVEALARGHDTVLIGEGIDIFVEEVPASLYGTTLGKSRIGARTGLNVITVRSADSTAANPGADTVLPEGAELVMLGTPEQRETFRKTFA